MYLCVYVHVPSHMQTHICMSYTHACECQRTIAGDFSPSEEDQEANLQSIFWQGCDKHKIGKSLLNKLLVKTGYQLEDERN